MNTLRALIALALHLLLASAAVAQTDRLYASSIIFTNSLHSIQGGAVLNSVTRSGLDEAGLAVWGDVRTTGRAGGTGGLYDLSLAYQGVPYAFTGQPVRGDGTSDGTYNYAFSYPQRDLYRYDRNWQNPVVVCTLPMPNNMGITYDTSTGLFWGQTATGADQIFSFDATGAVHSSFPTQGAAPFQDGLAYEPSTDTLWTISEGFNQDPYLTQYTKSGAMLQQFQIPGFTDRSIRGLEFDLSVVPAPSSLALIAAGSLVAARRRRG